MPNKSDIDTQVAELGMNKCIISQSQQRLNALKLDPTAHSKIEKPLTPLCCMQGLASERADNVTLHKDAGRRSVALQAVWQNKMWHYLLPIGSGGTPGNLLLSAPPRTAN